IKQLPPTLDDVMPFTGAHDLWYRINIPRLDDGNEYELLATIDGELYSGAGISNITAAGYTGQCGSLTEVGTGTTNSQKLVFSSDIGLRSAAQTFYLRVGTTGTLAANGTTGNEGRFNLTLKLQTI
ncbi:MAG: hypothetical protein KI786_05750, partial [Mameliella sp.]|nr:hypothetical protein [Phaeodactylibacter sp.]